MGQKDLAEKKLESFNDVFADVINNLFLFGDYIDENKLIDHTTEGIIKDEYGHLFDSMKDVKKKYVDQFEIAIIGIENESNVNKYLPIKIMQYEAAEYIKQLKEIEDEKRERIVPVVTCVLNFSKRKIKDKELLALMDVPNWLSGLVNEYSVKVVNVYYLPKEVKDKLQSDFKFVANVYSNEPDWEPYKDLVPDHIEECGDVLTVLTNDYAYKEQFAFNLERRRNGNMVVTGPIEMERQKLREEVTASVTASDNKRFAFLLFKNGHSIKDVRDYFTEEEFSDNELEDVFREFAGIDKDIPLLDGLKRN